MNKNLLEAIAAFLHAIDENDQQLGGTLLAGRLDEELYESAVTVVVRIGFLYFAEFLGLGPKGVVGQGAHRSISKLHQRCRLQLDPSNDRTTELAAWDELLATFRDWHSFSQVDQAEDKSGSRRSSSLFDPRRFPLAGLPTIDASDNQHKQSRQSRPAERFQISNRVVVGLLDAVHGSLKPTFDSARKSNGHPEEVEIEQLGHLYESLLDATVKRATEPMLRLNAAAGWDDVVALSELEHCSAQGEHELLKFLKSHTRRSTSVLQKWLAHKLPEEMIHRLQAQCSPEFWPRMQPYLGLLKHDSPDQPAIINPGRLYVEQHLSRRRSGTHYTPRELTDPIVRHTLEPLVFHGPSEGSAQVDWKRKSSGEILALRVCDLACGSGAFLLQACRYLADRLFDAWHEERIPSSRIAETRVQVNGPDRQGDRDDERRRRALLAVAQYCLFGVDKNPLAVEIAKLSLRLLCRADETSLNLNDSIKCGDSLLGIARFQSAPDADRSPGNRSSPPEVVDQVHAWSEEVRDLAIVDDQSSLTGQQPFRWPIEFSEVMVGNGGFDAFVGNPPFIGGRKIRRSLGGPMLRYLTTIMEPNASGNADLCAFFFLRAFELLRKGGTLGFLATNSICEGDTRATGLDRILTRGGVIYRAHDDQTWPGSAAVTVAVIHVAKGQYSGARFLDNQPVAEISSSLKNYSIAQSANRLRANRRLCYQGTVLAAKGFILSIEEAEQLIRSDPKNGEVIEPYFTGDEVFNSPSLSARRMVINFQNWPIEKAQQFEEPFRILQERVLPVRAKSNRKSHREKWWHFGDKRPELYAAFKSCERVLVQLRHAKFVCPQFVPAVGVFSESTVIFPSDKIEHYAILNSSIHDVWARETSGSLGTEIRYTPTDCFDTFPLPEDVTPELSSDGSRLLALIEELKQHFDTGVTGIYTLFHDQANQHPEMASLRNCQMDVDRAVARSYGWSDIPLGHGFQPVRSGVRFTLDSQAKMEILKRLLKLNQQRYREEID